MTDPLTDRAAADRARRKRSLAIALALVAFILLVFGVTLVQMGRNADRGAASRAAAAAAAPAAPAGVVR